MALEFKLPEEDDALREVRALAHESLSELTRRIVHAKNQILEAQIVRAFGGWRPVLLDRLPCVERTTRAQCHHCWGQGVEIVWSENYGKLTIRLCACSRVVVRWINLPLHALAWPEDVGELHRAVAYARLMLDAMRLPA
jgi:hypothetical protein